MQNRSTIFLLTKDCLFRESLSCYGNDYYELPNIDELARKGTVFHRHYAAGASTAMSMSAMLSGHYPHEFQSRKLYVNVIPEEYPSIFAYFQEQEYDCHLIWDKTWMNMAWRFVREFGDESKTKIHNLDIAQEAGGYQYKAKLEKNDDLLKHTYNQIYETLNMIDFDKKQFVWLHLPHVLKGRCGYMGDMDIFDNIVGYVRKLVGDDNIYISTDHGHMNMHKGLVGYGFHVYEPVIRIPLIVPRMNGMESVDYLTSNVDLPILLKEHRMPERKYIISETAYKGQPHRVTCVSDGRFKYIYNKVDKSEELYDLEWDDLENYNILKYDYFDKNRNKRMIYEELYFYPYKTEAFKRYQELKIYMNSFYVSEPWWFEKYGIIRKKMAVLKKYIPKK